MKNIEKHNEDVARKIRLIPLTKWTLYHDYPSIAGLRHLVFTMPEGFSKVVKRVNGRILLDEAAWFEFVEEQNKEGKSS